MKIFDISIFVDTSIAFIAFCLTASSIYIFNDYLDIDEDKIHPVKKNRPLASGNLRIPHALLLMAILMLTGFAIAYSINLNVFILTLIYFIINILYSLRLKNISIIDVVILSFGFIIRVFIGYEISGLYVSKWLILMTFLLALFLALSKRRDDIIIFSDNGFKTRKIVDAYSLEFINFSMIIISAVIIVSYIMYTLSPEIIRRIKSEYLYLTVIWVIIGILRYLQLTFVENGSGSPTMVFLKDRFLQITIIGWITSFWIILYM